jgi:hypothetical protein
VVVGAPQMEDAASGGEGVVLIDSRLRPDQFILQEADLGGDRGFRINGKKSDYGFLLMFVDTASLLVAHLFENFS